ncbi:hypothetical protein LDDCCGHA_3505 [Methylobacterium oxalidis]|nr:hypothetical protein LDDCCGHA_3505 [Methylobacterium oxalidis]
MFMPLMASGRRVTVFPPWPNTIIALMGLLWSIWSSGRFTASNQRVEVMPGASMFSLRVRALRPPLAGISSKRDCSHSYSTSQTRAQCFQAPSTRP